MSGTLSLRPLAVEDAETMALVLAHRSLYEFTGGEPPTRDELTRRYSIQVRGGSADGSEEWTNLIVLLDAQPIGYVQATRARDGDSAEIAWVIGHPWQGCGYASRAALLLGDHLAERGVRTLVAHIHPEHAASKRVAERLGMVPTDVVVDDETRWVGIVRAAPTS